MGATAGSNGHAQGSQYPSKQLLVSHHTTLIHITISAVLVFLIRVQLLLLYNEHGNIRITRSALSTNLPTAEVWMEVCRTLEELGELDDC